MSDQRFGEVVTEALLGLGLTFALGGYIAYTETLRWACVPSEGESFAAPPEICDINPVDRKELEKLLRELEKKPDKTPKHLRHKPRSRVGI